MTIQQKKKCVILSSRILIAAFAIILFIFPAAFADDNEFQIAMATQITSGVFDVINDCMTGDMYNYMVNGDYEGATAVAYVSIKMLGAFIVVAIALGRIFQNVERGLDPMECVFKALTEIGIAGMFIMYLDKIMSALATIGTTIVGYVNSLGSAEDAVLSAEELLIALTGDSTGGFFWQIKTIGMLVFPWVCSLLISVVAKFAIYQILFEIGIRKTFAPLAVADIYQEGLRSPGVRYLKRYLAVFIKLAICALTCFICNAITAAGGGASTATEWLTYLFDIIAINFTCVGFMFKTGEYANDIVGA